MMVSSLGIKFRGALSVLTLVIYGYLLYLASVESNFYFTYSLLILVALCYPVVVFFKAPLRSQRTNPLSDNISFALFALIIISYFYPKIYIFSPLLVLIELFFLVSYCVYGDKVLNTITKEKHAKI